MPHVGHRAGARYRTSTTTSIPEREKAAYEAAQRRAEARRAAPANERAYVDALVKRYSNDPKADLKALAVQYKDAMRALVARYPDDLDAATLYAESLMDLHPWQLWAADGTPDRGNRSRSSRSLESVLRARSRCTSARTTTTFTRRSVAHAGPRAAQRASGSRRWCPPPGTSSTCRRTSTCAPATTRAP